MKDTLTPEMCVVGCLLVDSDLYDGYITYEDFSDPRCKNIMLVIAALKGAGMQCDIVTVVNSVEFTPENKVFLAECIQIVPSIAPYRQYVDIVKRNSLSRKVSEVCTQAIWTADEDPIGAAGEVVGKLSELGKTETQTSDAEMYLKKLDSELPEKLKTGFSFIDKCSGGLVAGEVTGIAARPGVGKTILLINMLLNMHKQGKKILFNSLEMSPEQIYDKIISQRCGIPFEKVRDGILTDRERQEAKYIIRNLKNFDIVYSQTIQKLTLEARKLKPDVVAIDYLQILQGSRRKSKYEEVSEISVSCKMMAKMLDVPVIACLQLNRASEEFGKAPKLSDLRDSGQIEQDLALAILLHRNTIGEETKRTGVYIAKNRFGQTGAGELSFDGEKQLFTTVERYL